MKTLSSRKSLVLLAVIIVNLMNAIGGILGNVVSDDAKDFLKWAGIFQYRGLITAALLITGLGVAAWVFKAEKHASIGEVSEDAIPESERPTREFLADLAARYKNRNAHKLDGRYEISLIVSDDVEGTSLRHFDEEFDADAHSVQATKYIIDRFERQGRLLIVGNPGSGKTVLLVALAQYLAEKAQKDFRQPLPVIFNLDSWSSNYASFNHWAKAMLTKGYGVSPDLAGPLLDERRIIFLLDGLDELASNEEPSRAAQVRADCLSALDKSLHDGTMGTVICCRREEFSAMVSQTGVEPPLAAVVTVQDLTPGQIDRALIRASATTRDRFAAPNLLTALGNDSNRAYEQVLAIPFYFTTALQVFDSTKSPTIYAPDKPTLESSLISAFVDKKLEITRNPRRFSSAQTLVWLTWLAALLRSKNSVTFELSDLQPSTLKGPWKYRLLFSMIFGALGGMALSRFRVDTSTILVGFLLGVIGSQIIAEDFTRFMFRPLRRWRTWLNIVWQAFLATVIIDAGALLFLRWNFDPSKAWAVAFGSIGPALIFTLSVVIISIVLGVLVRLFIRLILGIFGGAATGNIETEDFPHWTVAPFIQWRTWLFVLKQGLSASLTGATIGGGAVLTFGCIIWSGQVIKEGLTLFKDLTIVEMVFMTALLLVLAVLIGAIIGTPFGVVIGILMALFRASRSVARFAKINSSYQRLKAGILFNVLQLMALAMLFLSIVWLPLWLYLRNVPPLAILITICGFGLLGFLRTPIFKHSVLRLCLTSEGAMPLRYAEFLSYAKELGILEDDGGQWRFRHQILQDYFANGAKNAGLDFPKI